MSFSVVATDAFSKRVKRLAKKYKSLAKDLLPVIEELSSDPTIGTPLGKNALKFV